MVFFSSSVLGMQETGDVKFFASKNKVYMRTGPGFDYPVKWEYTRKNVPFEVLDTYEQWVKMVDIDGETGWIHRNVLKSSSYAQISIGGALFFKRFIGSYFPVKKAPKYLIVDVINCDSIYCKIKYDDEYYWVAKKQLWGNIS